MLNYEQSEQGVLELKGMRTTRRRRREVGAVSFVGDDDEELRSGDGGDLGE